MWVILLGYVGEGGGCVIGGFEWVFVDNGGCGGDGSAALCFECFELCVPA